MLTDVEAIQEAKKRWKKINNGNVVRVLEIFTTRAFQDNSLIFIYDYHPISKTLAEHHLPAMVKNDSRKPQVISENVLWSYIAQITNALHAIHSEHLAARCIELTKIILTSENRIRLAGCAVLDVLQYGGGSGLGMASIQQQQQEDLIKFGKVMLSLATLMLPSQIGNNSMAALQSLANRYSGDLRGIIEWLISPPAPGQIKTVADLMTLIVRPSVKNLDLSLQQNDVLYSELAREVENGRIARLMMKMMTLMTEAEQNPTPKWSLYGELYPLKLFRIFVFGANSNDNGANGIASGVGFGANGSGPSLGHVLTCLNKLDVGTDELLQLRHPVEEDMFIISYRELKTLFERAFGDVGGRSKDAGALYRR
jgi:PAB-dependent poly(A)-specific ribonuclease subunit 3